MRTGVESPPEAERRKLSAFELSRARQTRRRLMDRLAGRIIAGGGFAIIASVIAILFFIVLEVWPLFRSAKVTFQSTFPVADLAVEGGAYDALAAGLEENLDLAYLVLSDGRVRFFDPADGSPKGESSPFPGTQNEKITSVWQSLDGKELLLGTERGRVRVLTIGFNPRFSEGKRSYDPSAQEKTAYRIDSDGRALTALVFAGDPEGVFGIAAITEDSRVLLTLREKRETLLGTIESDSSTYTLEARWSGLPLSIALDERLENIYVGAGSGNITRFSIGPALPPSFLATVTAGSSDAGITALGFLLGHRTLMAGDSQGSVSAWSLVRDGASPSGRRLVRIHDMADHTAAVAAFIASPRGKGFLSADEQGRILLQHTTSERLLAAFGTDEPSPIQFVHMSPKANAALSLNADRTLTYWKITNPHPEAGFRAFFGKIWYEGNDKPDYVWQSSAATDDFEPKLSVVPLLFGSMKGTFYALVLAVPLAILAALYTSQFMHHSFRNYVKPTVEIMAALPSVVLGFLAGLWLAPLIEDVVPGVFLMLVVLPLSVLLFAFLWGKVPRPVRAHLRPGSEILLLVPLLVIAVWISLAANKPVEHFFFDGSFTQWLFENFKERYDQRNAIVVGFAMGFAVIPLIYTISEDALSNVPKHLISGSLALGATPWQTAVRVVIPTAAAGIFSAVMIGFGRAVGETMIVLMATGNTPIMDWSMFNGFRTLSANIAVEIPEAPHGGTLYRLLFLTALLLFIITFIVNTVAELVRQKLREKYQKL